MGGKRWVHENQAAYEKARRELWKSPGSGAYVSISTRPPDDVLAEAQQRNQTLHSSLTAQLCGDPKPGQSALDRIQATAAREE